MPDRQVVAIYGTALLARHRFAPAVLLWLLDVAMVHVVPEGLQKGCGKKAHSCKSAWIGLQLMSCVSWWQSQVSYTQVLGLSAFRVQSKGMKAGLAQ